MADKKTGMELFQEGRPLEREFKIVFPADTTVETGVQIDTDIAAGSKFAWAIVGMRWSCELVAAPHTPVFFGGSNGSAAFALQLVRGELPATPVLVGRHDHDLIGEDVVEYQFGTDVGFVMRTWPREVPFMGVTQLPSLHVTMGSSLDWLGVSAATNRLVGVVLYHLVTAPKARHEDL